MSADKWYWLEKNCVHMSLNGSPSQQMQPSWFGKELPPEEGVKEHCVRARPIDQFPRGRCTWKCGQTCNMYKTAVANRDKSRRDAERFWLIQMRLEIRAKPRQSKVDKKRIKILGEMIKELDNF